MRQTATTLRLDDPLRHLRELAGLSHRALGMRVQPEPVSDAAVVDAERRGPRVRLATLAAYARAAGYVLWVVMQERRSAEASCQCEGKSRADCNWCAGELDLDICWCHVAEERDPALNYPPAAKVGGDLAVTVAGGRALLEALGLEMTLAVERGETVEERRRRAPCQAFSVMFGQCKLDAGHDGKHRRGRSEWR